MRWLKTEYLLKGIFLGLLLFAALRAAAPAEAGSRSVGLLVAAMLGGLALGLAAAAVLRLRQGYRVRGRLPAFLVFLLLESSEFVYAGVLLGLAAGVFFLPRTEDDTSFLLTAIAGGALLGAAFGALREVRGQAIRLGLSVTLAGGLIVAAFAWFGLIPDLADGHPLGHRGVFGSVLLLGVPMFYLLTFSGAEEESEVEIGAICALLALGLFMVAPDLHQFQTFGAIALLMIFFFYTTRVLPGLRVFKHALRGLSHARGGRNRQALLAYRRALELDPNHAVAREGYWAVHRSLNVDTLANEPQTLALVNFDLCVQRAGSLLLEPNPPAEKLTEANRLLDLVNAHKPTARPTVDYWRAVAATHARQYDMAAAALARVLDPEVYGRDSAARRAILLPAWQLALLLHDEVRQRAGLPQLALPGRRMDAIAAVERRLQEDVEDGPAWTLKRLLYQDVTEADYDAAAGDPSQVAAGFDHGYAQQLGLALINDPQRWRRGAEYLRLAARGLPLLGPSLFSQIAQAYGRNGEPEPAWHYYRLARQAGLSVGVKNLSGEDRALYFAVLKLLADDAHARGDLRAAIENYQLATEDERSGVETLRTLATLYEQNGDPLNALRVTEKALVYSARDPDLLQRKDRYYYSVMPDQLRGNPDAIPGGFDLDYCLRKARAILAGRDLDLDMLDWGQHLADLALAVQPGNRSAQLLLARARLRRGERAEAVKLLEGIRDPKPERFATGDDEEAWYQASRLLGDLYLNELGRPDLAVACFVDFRQSSKSGADTSFKLAQAYEQLGDRKRAVKCYQQVTAFDAHPLAPDARDALQRMQTS